MITNIDIHKWRPHEVKEWLRGLCDDSSWMNVDFIVNNNVDGQELLMITAQDLYIIGATKVDLQEHILEAVERLRYFNFNVSRETLQVAILRLACQSRSLQKQLVANRAGPTSSSNNARDERDIPNPTVITLSRDFQQREASQRAPKQRVDLDTLACVSAIVQTVRDITEIIQRLPFSRYDDYRSMKSLILALSIELTSTAQRDQFVERPNDIIEKSCKALADYCDRIVYGTKDILLIQPFQIRTVRVRRSQTESDFGLTIKSLPNCVHIIDKITPLSPAKKTNELTEGDEIVYLNQFIAGWLERNVQQLLSVCSQSEIITLMVKKNPSE